MGFKLIWILVIRKRVCVFRKKEKFSQLLMGIWLIRKNVIKLEMVIKVNGTSVPKRKSCVFQTEIHVALV